MTNGAVPECMEIDHIDRNPWNNRLVNLRVVTRTENRHNLSPASFPGNKSGRRGVSWCEASKKWKAYIGHNGGLVHLGYHTDKDDAVRAREEAERIYHPTTIDNATVRAIAANLKDQ